MTFKSWAWRENILVSFLHIVCALVLILKGKPFIDATAWNEKTSSSACGAPAGPDGPWHGHEQFLILSLHSILSSHWMRALYEQPMFYICICSWINRSLSKQEYEFSQLCRDWECVTLWHVSCVITRQMWFIFDSPVFTSSDHQSWRAVTFDDSIISQ